MDTAPTWITGEAIPVRHQWRGRVWVAHPSILVSDTPERLILFEPAGSIRQWSHFDFETGAIAPPTPKARHSIDALTLLSAGAAHAVSLMWGQGVLLAWYVDMQAFDIAWRRVRSG